MARTKEQEQMKQQHPYAHVMKHPLYKQVKRALTLLEENQDVVLQTDASYIVGFIVNQILKSESKAKDPSDVIVFDSTKIKRIESELHGILKHLSQAK